MENVIKLARKSLVEDFWFGILYKKIQLKMCIVEVEVTEANRGQLGILMIIQA